MGAATYCSVDTTWGGFVRHRPVAISCRGSGISPWHTRPPTGPLLQLRAAYRRQDGGIDGRAADTGYVRMMAAPGGVASMGKVKFYADVALPLYTNARGHQLFANELWKLNISYHF